MNHVDTSQPATQASSLSQFTYFQGQALAIGQARRYVLLPHSHFLSPSKLKILS